MFACSMASRRSCRSSSSRFPSAISRRRLASPRSRWPRSERFDPVGDRLRRRQRLARRQGLSRLRLRRPVRARPAGEDEHPLRGRERAAARSRSTKTSYLELDDPALLALGGESDGRGGRRLHRRFSRQAGRRGDGPPQGRARPLASPSRMSSPRISTSSAAASATAAAKAIGAEAAKALEAAVDDLERSTDVGALMQLALALAQSRRGVARPPERIRLSDKGAGAMPDDKTSALSGLRASATRPARAAGRTISSAAIRMTGRCRWIISAGSRSATSAASSSIAALPPMSRPSASAPICAIQSMRWSFWAFAPRTSKTSSSPTFTTITSAISTGFPKRAFIFRRTSSLSRRESTCGTLSCRTRSRSRTSSAWFG